MKESLSEVKIPAGFAYPRPQRLGAIRGLHNVSSDRVYIVDAQTFLIPNFTYDGGAPGKFIESLTQLQLNLIINFVYYNQHWISINLTKLIFIHLRVILIE